MTSGDIQAFWGALGYFRAVFHGDILRSFGVF